jgi:benzylsuccinate CoA-transferase BbsF subunit
VTAALAILAGIAHARRTGRGVHFDLSMAESTIALMVEPFLEYLATGREPVPVGNRVPDCAPHNTYRCADDRWVAITAHDDTEWQGLCETAAMPDDFAQLHELDARRARLVEIDAALDGWCATLERDAIVRRLRAARVCCAPVLEFDELLTNEHFVARDLMTRLEADGIGSYHIVKLPWLQTPAAPARYAPSPKLGQDNEYVFTEILGLSPPEITRLTERNIFV